MLEKILKRFSILLLFLPYSILLYGKVEIQYLFCLLFLLALDLTITKNLNWKQKNIFLLIVLLLFYSIPLHKDSLTILHNLRFRNFFIVVSFFFLLVVYLNWKFNNSFLAVNIFFVSFILTSAIFKTAVDKDLPSFFAKNFQFNDLQSNNLPIVLIIVDEYSSPIELFKIEKDSSLFDFDKRLINKNWITNNSILSQEKYTLKSIPSLFNYNLSNDSIFKKINSYDKRLVDLVHENNLIDSLINKGYNVYNYGLIGFNKALNDFDNLQDFNEFETSKSLVFLPGFIGDFFGLSILNPINYRLRDKEKFKQNVYENLLSTSFQNNSFYYYHLYAPHPPFSFPNKFQILPTNTKNYIKFWKFTNELLINALEKITEKNKVRIILAGDHGYREDERIDYRYTYAAFFGFGTKFNEDQLTIQDLGQLINSITNK